MIAFIIGSVLVAAVSCIETDNEYYLSLEPLPGQTDSWPIARLAVVEFRKETEDGREVMRSDCHYFPSAFMDARFMDNLSKAKVKRIPKEEMDELQRRCKRWSLFSDAINWFYDKAEIISGVLSGIYPGTKWCGLGNISKSYDELGEEKEVDMCCRDHDHCENIASDEEKFGIKNTNRFTMLNCKCEDAFKKCLIKANTGSAKTLIAFYFGLHDPDCFTHNCKKRSLFERRQPCLATKVSYKSLTG